ncbi:MAG TPA: hypothetical protein VII95_15565 [Terriglobales bacterium]
MRNFLTGAGTAGRQCRLWFAFCRTHKTLRVTPAMEAGIASHPWTVAELLSFGS